MDENSKTRQGVMSLLDAELQHAGEETALSPLMLQLEQLRITPERELPRMEFLFRLFGKPCFPRGELVAITGKAKSGKTFVTSMLMAVGSRSPDSAASGEGSLTPDPSPARPNGTLSSERKGEGSLTPNPSPNGEGSIYRLPLTREGKDPLRVLWYDTEQSDESTQDILRNRVLRMQTGGGTLDVFNVRAVEWKVRRALLTEAVRRCKPDLVIVDGIRDLVNDINDGVLAQEVMEELLHLATRQVCCIVCVLHQNKSGEDRNLRGWIGTELMNKAFEVYATEKLMPQRVFKLEQTLTRKYDIEQTLYFEVSDEGLPVACAVPAGDADAGSTGERLPQLNPEYIVHESDGKDGWHFDVMRLFLDAMGSEQEVGGGELRDRVMRLSGIAIPFKYNKLLAEAIERKVIVKSVRDGYTIYRPAPF